MWLRYSDAIIFALVIGAQWLIYQTYVSIKAKAFNEGYKRGRATLNVRKIVK